MFDAKKVKVTGRGIQPTGVRVGDTADFKILTDGAGEGTPEVRVIGPGNDDNFFKLKISRSFRTYCTSLVYSKTLYCFRI